MKRGYIIVISIVFLLSCKKSELEFSCVPVINEFVIEHREELSKITVIELSSYDFQLQKAIFNSWDYQKKRSAWIDKLHYVQGNVALTELETTHIQKLIDHITEDYFLKERIDNDLESRSHFASEWVNYSMNELGWSKQFISFLVYRLYTEQSQLDSEVSMLKSIGRTIRADSETGNCDCNTSVDFCGVSLCQSGECTITTGCGWLWSMACDGLCF